MKTALIVNPFSAGGSTGNQWDRLRVPLLEQFPRAQEFFTACAGDATRLTREALLDGFRLIIGVGGDGTNNECVNGFFHETGEVIDPEASYGFIPRGTGCDLARFLGIPRDIDQAAKVIAESASWPVDVGLLEVTKLDGSGRARHHWLNIMDFGIGGMICARVNQSSKRFGGFLSFAWASIESLFYYQDQEMELQIDDSEGVRGIFRSVVIANGRYFGGGMNINPKAQLDDGKFDMLLLPNEGIAHYMKWMPKLYQERGLLDHPGVPQQRISKLVARATDPSADVFVEMDGENPGKLPLTVQVLPGIIRLKAPYPGNLNQRR